jgi:hypothetical protein
MEEKVIGLQDAFILEQKKVITLMDENIKLRQELTEAMSQTLEYKVKTEYSKQHGVTFYDINENKIFVKFLEEPGDVIPEASLLVDAELTFEIEDFNNWMISIKKQLEEKQEAVSKIQDIMNGKNQAQGISERSN